MSITSTASLVDTLRQHRLLDLEQLEELKSFQARFPDSKALAGALIQRGWLTPYQANQLLNGKGQELVLGSHILLERLGEGGMGQVFKARHRNLGRISAIKLIRKDRLDNPNAVRRFQREVRSAAALSHPNIVRAYDADEIAGTHLLVMEYIEGAIDLAKLVKKNGPLPVPQACEYIRQAAMGLQHASERGMVHRDIKPANLLLTAGGKTVKVLDMGLARLDHPSEDDDDKSSTMTQEGAVMGTPDYIAPEQALDTHTVDIRADLYSLGCTFYYLLTGRVPFPGGTLLQKLNKHQNEQPMPVEKLRPEVPPEVATVVRKLMAKKPVDRYQTPAEAAAALDSVRTTGSGDSLAASDNDSTLADGVRVAAVPRGDTLNSAFAYMAMSHTEAWVDAPERLARKTRQRRRLLFGLAGGAFLFVSLAVILLIVFKEPAEPKQSVKDEQFPVFVITPSKKRPTKVDDAWIKQVAGMSAEEQVKAVAAKLKELNFGFDIKLTQTVENDLVTGLSLLTDNVTDISPVQALNGLKVFSCSGSAHGKGTLSDLSPLKGMPLTFLDCGRTQVADLSPLNDMKLTQLECGGTEVTDLSPLKGMPLTFLNCGHTNVADLSPLKGMPLTFLDCGRTQVTDLSPLKDMPLTSLQCQSTHVSDLSALMDMKLTTLNCGGTKVSDLSPLQRMPLTSLRCYETKVSDLSPLTGMPLTDLHCVSTNVSDLSPLKGMLLASLYCAITNVSDISPLKGMPLTELDLSGTKVADLSPLKGMRLTNLGCAGTKVTDLSPLKGIPLKGLYCDFMPERDAKILRSITTLQTINGKEAREFWKEVKPKEKP